MQQWEYCAIGKLRIANIINVRLIKLTSNGGEEISTGASDDGHAFARLIAQLGEEGWEMTGVGTDPEIGHTLYFKRPK